MQTKMAVYGGINRQLFLATECVVCKAPVWTTRTYINLVKYCSRRCASEASKNPILELECHRCSKRFSRKQKRRKNRSGIVFCSRACKDDSQKIGGTAEMLPSHYGAGETTYRQRALKYYGRTCTQCGYGEDIRMVDVHHRDRNRRNNKIDNLEVLCVWCHALETRKNWPVK